MNTKDHKKHLENFSALTKEILSSKEATKNILIKAGINTPTGRLTHTYSEKASSIGYKAKK